MRLERTKDGFAIDAPDLGALFELPVPDVQHMMRSGLVTSRVERGEGEDAGRYRLTFFGPNRRIRLIVSEAGEVLQRNRVLDTRAEASIAPRGDAG